MRQLNYSISRQEFSPNALFAFNVMFMGNEVAEIQKFSTNNSIRFTPKKPGLYCIEAIVNDNNSLKDVITPFTYIEPDNTYNLDSDLGKNEFERNILRCHKNLNPSAYRAIIHSQKFDFLYFPSNEQRLFVLCPSAIIRGKFLVPYFYRWSWARDGIFPGNVIVVSDPTFDVDDKIEAGWFVGEKDKDGTKNFCDIIKIFNKLLKISFKQTIFWGSSAGGFIAIQFSKYFPGSKAVAVNAQTDIDKSPWYKLLYELSFKGLSREEINSHYQNRLKILPCIDKLKSNKIVMVQNTLDEHHYHEQFLPFASQILQKDKAELTDGFYKNDSSNFSFWVYTHPDGHMAETKEMARKIMKLLEI